MESQEATTTNARASPLDRMIAPEVWEEAKIVLDEAM